MQKELACPPLMRSFCSQMCQGTSLSCYGSCDINKAVSHSLLAGQFWLCSGPPESLLRGVLSGLGGQAQASRRGH